MSNRCLLYRGVVEPSAFVRTGCRKPPLSSLPLDLLVYKLMKMLDYEIVNPGLDLDSPRPAISPDLEAHPTNSASFTESNHDTLRNRTATTSSSEQGFDRVPNAEKIGEAVDASPTVIDARPSRGSPTSTHGRFPQGMSSISGGDYHQMIEKPLSSPGKA